MQAAHLVSQSLGKLAEITDEMSGDDVAGHLAGAHDLLSRAHSAAAHADTPLSEAAAVAGEADAPELAEMIDTAADDLRTARENLATAMDLTDSESSAASAWGQATTGTTSPGSAVAPVAAGRAVPAAAKPSRDIDNGESLRGATKAEVADAAHRAGWTLRGRSRDGNGDVWEHPRNRGEQVIINDGYPGAKDPLHGGPYIKVSRNGQKTRYPLSEM